MGSASQMLRGFMYQSHSKAIIQLKKRIVGAKTYICQRIFI
jgi:hypothetical protein